MATEEKKTKPAKKRFYRKRVRVFNLIDKIKLWASRTGQLHGIRSMEIIGDTARLTTHCNKEFTIKNSLNSRSGRWLRNKWFVKVCPACRVPDWKLEKYSSTIFNRYQGSMLAKKNNDYTDRGEANPASPIGREKTK
ncbi:MAG: pyrrolysine--tRNA(Pyl) ligase small subunit [Desulforhopalus sp.]